jgi:glycosyltransferase involved in cell wall biosynthesis
MKKNKIVIIHHSGLLGGAGLSLYFTWIELLKHYDVSCYVPNDPPELKDFLKQKGLSPKSFDYRLGKVTFYSGGNSVFNLKFWYHSLRIFFHKGYWDSILKSEKPNLVIVNSIVLCWFGLFSRNYKIMCFVRETLKGRRNSFPNRVIAHFLEKFSLVTFLSDYDKDIWNLTYPNTIVSYNFMNSSDYSKKQTKLEACTDLNINSASFNVLFVGGMNRIKGTEVLVNSMKLLKDDNINLIIAGNNPGLFSFSSIVEFWKSLIYLKNKYYYHKINYIISTSFISNKVHYVGIQNEIRKAFDACDVLVVPMIESHQARPVFEFGCQKKPVIITGFSNIKDFVKNNYNGLTFSVGSYNELAIKIKTLYNDKKLYQRLGENNYLNSIQNHERKVVITKLVNNIDKLFLANN